MLRYLGHFVRAGEGDPTKVVTVEQWHGHWVHLHISTTRARGRPNDGWAEWAWGEACRAMLEVSSSTNTHIADVPANPNSQDALVKVE